ncbi:Hypothetical predicted protein [Paramuricea clavata]|uniref:Uncharacterized protein n=1 Tax=Paramuricea clavata TaxID=317549 RepID=A0A6S7HL47_PARCT|nr:Hypothetical predicted protein [Paramuricea clavata]
MCYTLLVEIDRHKEKLADLCLNEQALSEKQRRLEPKTFTGFSKRKERIRQMTPSTLCPDNSEKLCSDMPVRSAQRRCKETLDPSEIIHRNSEGNKAALDGLWVMLANKCSEQQLHSYVEASPKMQKIIPMVVKTQTKGYEESHDNLIAVYEHEQLIATEKSLQDADIHYRLTQSDGLAELKSK